MPDLDNMPGIRTVREKKKEESRESYSYHEEEARETYFDRRAHYEEREDDIDLDRRKFVRLLGYLILICVWIVVPYILYVTNVISKLVMTIIILPLVIVIGVVYLKRAMN